MKKDNPFLVVFALLLAGIFVFFLKTIDTNSDLVQPIEKRFGAFESLLWRAETQLYPNKSMPKHAYYSAWETLQKMTNSQERGGNADTWEALGPFNRGGRTLALAFNPKNAKTLYAGSASGGLWRSYTAGEGATAWHQVPIPFPVLSVSSITFLPNDSLTMYIGTGEVYNATGVGTGAIYRAARGSAGMGILKTTDGGQTWKKSLDWSYNQEHGVWAIKVVSTNTSLVYANTTDGVYKSTNAGASWNRVLAVDMGTDLLIHPQNENLLLAAFGNLGSSGKGIYRSANGGATWDIIASDLPTGFQGKIQMNYAPSNPNVVYASIGNGFSTATGASWLCKSLDFGQTWTVQSTTDYSIFQGWFAHDVAVNPLDENKLAVIGVEVWRSNDGGLTLEKVSVGGIGPQNAPSGGQASEPNFVHSDAHDVVWHPSLTQSFYVASDGGINRTKDGGNTFELLTGGYQTAQFYNGISCSPVDSAFFIGGLQDNGTNVWNGDFTWANIFGGDGSWTASNPFDVSVYYLSYQFLNAYRVTNGNLQYMDIPYLNPIGFIAPFVLSPLDGKTMYAGSAGLAKSTDGGTTWSLKNNGAALNSNSPISAMEVAAQNPNVLFVATAPTYPFSSANGAKFFVSTNGGTSFNERTNGLPDRFVMDIAVDPTNDKTAYVTLAGFGTGHVFKTTNYGLVWEDITHNLPDAPTNAIIVDPLFPNHLYVGNDLGVFASVDGGENWFTFMEGLPAAVLVFDLKISNQNRKLRIGSHGNGAYQRALLPDNFVQTQSAFAKTIQLSIYPNPIDISSSIISFNAAKSGKTYLQLVDSQGRIVSEKTIETSLENKVLWPFGAVKIKGQYFLRLEMEGEHIVRGVIL